MDTNFRNSLNGVNNHFKTIIALPEVQNVIGIAKQGKKQIPTLYASDLAVPLVEEDLNKKMKGENAKAKHKSKGGEEKKAEPKKEAEKKAEAPKKEKKAEAPK